MNIDEFKDVVDEVCKAIGAVRSDGGTYDATFRGRCGDEVVISFNMTSFDPFNFKVHVIGHDNDGMQMTARHHTIDVFPSLTRDLNSAISRIANEIDRSVALLTSCSFKSFDDAVLNIVKEKIDKIKALKQEDRINGRPEVRERPFGIDGNWHKEVQMMVSHSPEYGGENLGVSIEGQFIVLNSFGSGHSSDHNALYEKWEKIADMVSAAPEMYVALKDLMAIFSTVVTEVLSVEDLKRNSEFNAAKSIIEKIDGGARWH